MLLSHSTILLTGAFWPEIDLLHKSYHKKHLSSKSLPKLSKENKKKIPIIFSSGTRRLCIEVLELGVGPVDSALSLQQRILTIEKEKGRWSSLFRPIAPIQEILLLGSAGLYLDKNSPKSLARKKYSYGPTSYAQSCDFYFHDLAVLEGKAKQPELLCTHIQSKAGPLALAFSESLGKQKGLSFFENLSTNTASALSLRSPRLPSKKRNGEPLFRLENLEAFALARIAARHKLAFSAFFALSNGVGPQGSKEWQKNYRLMSIVLQEALKKILNTV